MAEFAQRIAFDNTAERIAVLGYYAAKYLGQETFTAKEVSAWFANCGFRQPAQLAVALSDARRKYQFVASRARGQWTLTPRGEQMARNLAAASFIPH